MKQLLILVFLIHNYCFLFKYSGVVPPFIRIYLHLAMIFLSWQPRLPFKVHVVPQNSLTNYSETIQDRVFRE